MRNPRGDDRRRRLLLCRKHPAKSGRRSRSRAAADQSSANAALLADEKGAGRFFEECRVPQSVELLVNEIDGSEEARLPCERPFAIIGRAAECDARIAHADVSDRHAYLQLIGGRVYCCDLASRTGTYGASGRKVSGWLDGEEAISIGPYSIQFAGDGAACSLPEAAPEQDASQPPVALEFLNGSAGPASWRVKPTVTLIGRSRQCKVRLAHKSVSRVHASLVRTGGGLWVIDLLGEEGTLVNGEPVSYARLEEGSELKIGTFRMRIVHGSPTTPARQGRRQPTGHSARSSQATALSVPISGESSGRNGLPRGQFSEEFVGALIHEFTTRQQQTFDQAQQSIRAMAEMLCEMHHSQMDVVREELGRLRELTGELGRLRSELARGQTTPAAEPPSAEPPAAPPPAEESSLTDNTSTRHETEHSAEASPSPQKSAPRQDPAAKKKQARSREQKQARLREQLATVEAMIEEQRSGWWQTRGGR